MKLTNFSGGINSREEPHLLGINEAVVYSNIDNTGGSLKPIKSLIFSSSHFLQFIKLIIKPVFLAPA